MYVCNVSLISPILLNIAKLLAERPMSGTAVYVGISRITPENAGHIGGQRFPKEHILPPIMEPLPTQSVP